jgi:GT2 family glycosyltransferase
MAADKFDVIASIVAYNNPPEMIRSATESFLSTSLRVKLYIIDNSQQKGLADHLNGLPVSYFYTAKNIGFGRGHNQALSIAEPSKYFLFLNPDVVIGRGAVDVLWHYLEAHPQAGIVCPKVLNTDGSVQHLNKRHPTVPALFVRRFLPQAWHGPFRKILDRYEMKDVGYDTECMVPCVSGAFMLCRRSALDKLGGFNPNYFLYFEDFDLSLRMQQMGYKTMFFPHATVIHCWERASHTSWRIAFIFMASALRFFRTWGWKWQ